MTCALIYCIGPECTLYLESACLRVNTGYWYRCLRIYCAISICIILFSYVATTLINSLINLLAYFNTVLTYHHCHQSSAWCTSKNTLVHFKLNKYSTRPSRIITYITCITDYHKTKHFRWWNVIYDMCTIWPLIFWSWFDENDPLLTKIIIREKWFFFTFSFPVTSFSFDLKTSNFVP